LGQWSDKKRRRDEVKKRHSSPFIFTEVGGGKGGGNAEMRG